MQVKKYGNLPCILKTKSNKLRSLLKKMNIEINLGDDTVMTDTRFDERGLC